MGWHRQQRDLLNRSMTTEEATAEPHLARMQNAHVESIPGFDSGGQNMRTQHWIHAFKQFQDMFGQSEINSTYHMQSKLRGNARSWYDTVGITCNLQKRK